MPYKPEEKPNSRASALIERLYKTCKSDLVAWLLRRYGPGPPEPEDIAQAAFARMASLDDLDRIHDHRAFLFTIAARLALMDLRTLSRNRRFIDREMRELGLEIEEISPERIYIAEERFRRLSKALAGMSPKQREIVIRCRVYGQTYEQIKQETGWSLGTISNHVRAAMLTLHDTDACEEEADE